MVNYANGKIYKIVSSYTDMVYVGNTTKKLLSQRMYNHRTDCRRWIKGKTPYCASMSIMLYPDAHIVLLEEYPCKTKDQLKAQEQHWIDKFGDLAVNLNKSYTGYENKKDYMQIYNSTYRQKNRKKMLKQKKDDYHKNRKRYLKQGKERYQRQKAERSKIIECNCGSKCRQDAIKRHERTNKHQTYLVAINI